MKHLANPTVYLIAAAAVLAGVALVPHLRPTRPDPTAAPAPDEVVGPPDEPDRCCRVIQARLRAKRLLVSEVAARRMSLVEAAAHFRDLNETPPDCPDRGYRSAFEGSSDGERLCRQVISWVRAENEGRSPLAEATLTVWLEAELVGLLARDGIVRLPE
jgi:hypothetical protein